jgi:phosphoribosylformylglycinamidine synthase PurS subunit
MARVVVDVMPKAEILDPQGKAVTGALNRLGFTGVTVRQGKRFELDVEGELTDDRLEEVRHAAETLLANTVIETFQVRVEAPAEHVVAASPGEPGSAA